MTFYPLKGSTGSISFDLPEPLANIWWKQSEWKR
jgi:hypothetical protein